MKKVKDTKLSQIGNNIYDMVWSCHSEEGDCNDAMLTQKAMEVRNFWRPKHDLKLSHARLGKCKARHIIACHNLCGESGDVDSHGVGASQATLLAIIAT